MNAMTPSDAKPFTQIIADLPDSSTREELNRLFAALDQVSWAQNPYTARLLACELRRKSQKVIEEAAGLVLETVRWRTDAAVREGTDLLYHVLVLWHECGIAPEQV